MSYCYCCHRRHAADPCDCSALYCRRCLRCGKHCRCVEPQLVGEDEQVDDADGPDEPAVVPPTDGGANANRDAAIL